MVSYWPKSSEFTTRTTNMNRLLSIGAFLGLTAVGIGAFGAHLLADTLTPHALNRYNTGVEYQFYHVVAILVVSLLSNKHSKTSPLLKYSGVAFAIGIILFSGSLYLYALTGITKFGMITPIGGLALIMGWLLLMIYGLKRKL